MKIKSCFCSLNSKIFNRSEGARLIESLEEAVAFASAGSGRLHLSHFKTAGEANWGKLDAALELLEKARERGLRVTADRYPYTYSQTSLSVILPPRYDSMRDREIQEKLSRDPAECERLIEDVVIQLLSHVQLFATPWTVACQASLSMEFSKQEFWSG